MHSPCVFVIFYQMIYNILQSITLSFISNWRIGISLCNDTTLCSQSPMTLTLIEVIAHGSTEKINFLEYLSFKAYFQPFTPKLLTQGHRYHKLRKQFGKFFRSYSDLLSKFGELLLRCIHLFNRIKWTMWWTTCAFLVMNTHQWSLAKQSSLKVENDRSKVPKQDKAKRDGAINPQIWWNIVSRICLGRNPSPGILRWSSLQTKEDQMWSEFRLVGLWNS